MDYDVVTDDVTFTYEGAGGRPAIRNINLNIERGETVGIMGPAGAGKSTFCRILNGLIPQFFDGKMEGQVFVEGIGTKEQTISFFAHHVGFVFDDPASQIVSSNVEDEIAFGLENYGIQKEEMVRRIKYYIKACRLEGYEERNPHSLSGGEQQACILAAILAMQPQILVLDEPTSRLDPIGSSKVYSLINDLVKEKKHTIIIADNKIEEIVDIVDRLLLMKEGEIILEGEPREVLQHTDLISKAGVKPPQVSELFHKLAMQRLAFERIPANLEEARASLLNILADTRKDRMATLPQSSDIRNLGKPIIEARNLWQVYPNGTVALMGVDIKVFEGEFMSILGQNGSGKTTLIKHFNGLLKPTRGEVYVYGMNVAKTLTSTLAARIGFVFQNPDQQLFARTVRRELEFGPQNLKLPAGEIEKRVEYALEAVRLNRDVLDEAPTSLSTAVKQRVNIASVVAMKPSVLVVDEPTTGQDPMMRREVMELMREQNKKGVTIIVVTHDMQLVAEYASRCVVMKSGKVLLEGTPKEVFKQTELLSETFLKPPQITMLAQMLNDYGMPPDVLTVDEMSDYILRRVGR